MWLQKLCCLLVNWDCLCKNIYWIHLSPREINCLKVQFRTEQTETILDFNIGGYQVSLDFISWFCNFRIVVFSLLHFTCFTFHYCYTCKNYLICSYNSCKPISAFFNCIGIHTFRCINYLPNPWYQLITIVELCHSYKMFVCIILSVCFPSHFELISKFILYSKQFPQKKSRIKLPCRII